ncbi:MAG: ATP-dependent DNA helicase DinG [Spirochaetales bacterium]|nr:ATP-dependent DNA helicase DinG [Spirochaetales bacterium]
MASDRFTVEAAAELRTAIADAGYNEVFAAGKLDDTGLVAEIIVGARGSVSSVPAIAGFLDRGDVLIHNHPSGLLEPSDADLAIASRAGENGVGSYIVDDAVSMVYVVAEPVRARALIAIDPDELAGVLEAGGKLASRLRGYEPRLSQLDLVRHIATAMNDGYVLAAEAGTGVGKSFAYLIPAFAWAARNKERVLVSTATINLQRQLMDKDIPAVASIFKKKLKAVLVKGRGNYLCKTRLYDALDEEGLFAGDDHPLRILAAWAESSATGDRADLSFWPDESLWSRVRSESDDCLNARCPNRESCFVLKLKREAADADIIVANHHILFSDLASRAAGSGYESTAVLPPYTSIIFDEAHAIESSATSFFSEELTRFSVFRQSAKLYREKRGRRFGVIVKLQNIKGLPPGVLKRFPDAADALLAAIAAADEAALGLVGSAANYRLVVRSVDVEHAVLKPLGDVERCLLSVAELLKDALAAVPDAEEGDQSVREAQLALVRLSESASVCARFRGFDEDTERVYWLDRRTTSQGDAFVRFCITPVDIADMMNEAVFDRFRSIICTSATLSVGGSFEFWKRRVGLSNAESRHECVAFPSPFPFERNALLGAATDAPSPDSAGWQAWINDAVYDLIVASGGRALVLFTSYTALRAAWDSVKPRLDSLGISAFRQGDDERSRLLDAFKVDVASVLFATDSFWEGVDAPGETLELVIITKLPFRVPTDPVQKARAEAVERRGGNSFMDLSLPEAVIRFKQGFGRLIRHSDDRGAVVVLDVRLLAKRYGAVFIRSLPRVQTSFKPIAELASDLRAFLGRG